MKHAALSGMSDFDCFVGQAEEHMTEERARRIRELRVKKRFTWRRVSETVYQEWGREAGLGGFNQIWGEALCFVAARLLGEDSDDDNWNGGRS